MSAGRRFIFLAMITIVVVTVSAQPQKTEDRDPRGANLAGADVARRPELGVQTNTAAVTTSNASANGAPQDDEPSIVAVRRGPNALHYKMTAYMRYTNGAPQINWAGSYDLANFDRGVLPFPSGSSWDRSGDPLCSVNPFTSGPGNGRHMYCIGTMYQNGVSGGIGVWKLPPADPATWSAPQTIDTVTHPNFLDKPSIAVSWYPGTYGWVYAAAVFDPDIDPNSTLHNTLRMYRSFDGTNFSRIGEPPLNPQISGHQYQSPIVVIDSSNGVPYVVFLSWSGDAIHMTRAGNGTYFQPPVTLPLTSPKLPRALLGPGGDDAICDPNGGSCANARSMLMARYHPSTHTIGVVWHGREPHISVPNRSRVNTDIYFASFNTITQTWNGPPKRIRPKPEADSCLEIPCPAIPNDQWNPALDYDGSGNYLITFYDRRDDSSDRQYRLYAAKTDSAGNVLEENKLIYSPATPGVANGYPNKRLGEYQDVWYWFGYWYSAFVYIPDPSGPGEVYITQIQP